MGWNPTTAVLPVQAATRTRTGTKFKLAGLGSKYRFASVGASKTRCTAPITGQIKDKVKAATLAYDKSIRAWGYNTFRNLQANRDRAFTFLLHQVCPEGHLPRAKGLSGVFKNLRRAGKIESAFWVVAQTKPGKVHVHGVVVLPKKLDYKTSKEIRKKLRGYNPILRNKRFFSERAKLVSKGRTEKLQKETEKNARLAALKETQQAARQRVLERYFGCCQRVDKRTMTGIATVGARIETNFKSPFEDLGFACFEISPLSSPAGYTRYMELNADETCALLAKNKPRFNFRLPSNIFHNGPVVRQIGGSKYHSTKFTRLEQMPWRAVCLEYARIKWGAKNWDEALVFGMRASGARGFRWVHLLRRDILKFAIEIERSRWRNFEDYLPLALHSGP